MVGAGTDRTKPPLGGGPAVILVRPQLAVNIGMCARAMANFGLDDLRLVNPREGWPRTDDYRDVAYSAAAGATDLLDARRVFATVEEAVGDLQRRLRDDGARARPDEGGLSPSVAMAATAAAAGEKRGILFGPERTGLDNDEVALADAIITFPSSPAYASLNLAQAVLLCGYEWFKAAHGDAPPPSTIPRAGLPAGAARDASRLLRLSRGEARRERLLPAGDQEARHAAKPAQHLPSHGADAAGRTHVMGGGGSAGRGTARRGQDAQADSTGKDRGVAESDAPALSPRRGRREKGSPDRFAARRARDRRIKRRALRRCPA